MTAFASSAEQDHAAVPHRAQPRVWVVLSDKRGDNGQVEAVVKAMDWHCQHKHVHMREPFVFGKPKVEASLHHLDLSRSDPLEPPWPDLILTIGRRPSMVALWIREQSGGRTKIVLFGKPSGRLELYDLVIASAENQLPPLPNVLRITWPLMRPKAEAVAEAAKIWAPRLAELPRPLIGVMVGGPTGPYVFDAAVVNRLIELAAEVAGDMGGTPYIATSRRTPPAVVKKLKDRLPRGAHIFDWTAGADDNPYLGLLGLADGFLVTGDSISMLVEVAQQRKPLAILTPSRGLVGTLDQMRRGLARRLFEPGTATGGRLRRHGVGRGLYHLGLLTQTRDFSAFHNFLIDSGLAVRAGDGFPSPQGSVPDDLPRVVARVKALNDDPSGAGPDA